MEFFDIISLFLLETVHVKFPVTTSTGITPIEILKAWMTTIRKHNSRSVPQWIYKGKVYY